MRAPLLLDLPERVEKELPGVGVDLELPLLLLGDRVRVLVPRKILVHPEATNLAQRSLLVRQILANLVVLRLGVGLATFGGGDMLGRDHEIVVCGERGQGLHEAGVDGAAIDAR